MDIEKFNWLMSTLKIKYVDPLESTEVKLTKAEARRQKARDAAAGVMEQKMAALRARLAEERVRFEKYKQAELERIEAELKELGLGQMNSLPETLKALGYEHLIPKPKPVVSEDEMRWQKKLKLLYQKKEEQDEKILKAHGFLTPKEMPFLPEH